VEFGEWNCKGATLSNVTVQKEYRVDRAFIVKIIRQADRRKQEEVLNLYKRALDID
jgi:hypothetical protein